MPSPNRVGAVIALATLLACTSTDSASTGPTAVTPRLINPNAIVIAAAGDIACASNTVGIPCQHAATANLVSQIDPDAVLLLGDNQYEDGTYAEYLMQFGPTWGKFKSITYPVPGNHEYQTAGAAGYFDYFNGVGMREGRAGDRSMGYYSFELGPWHLIALNSNCAAVGGCHAGSAQEMWLRSDLAAHSANCMLAFWHHPLFSSGVHGNDPSTRALWQALYDAKADIVLTGHDHDYERFAAQDASGMANAGGVVEFVVGTGGKEQRPMGETRANSIIRANTNLGVLRLTLRPSGYDFDFVAVGGSITDHGSGSCVGASALPGVSRMPASLRD